MCRHFESRQVIENEAKRKPRFSLFRGEKCHGRHSSRSPIVAAASQTLSIVIPLDDEEANAEALLSRCTKAAPRARCRRELIYVDDGSSDSSWPPCALRRSAAGHWSNRSGCAATSDRLQRCRPASMPCEIPSRIANEPIARVTGFALSDDGCGLKAYRAAGRCSCWPMTADSSMPGVDRRQPRAAAPGTRPARLSRDAAVMS
jgi:hypothetical protein